MEDAVDALPRTDVDLEAELESLREWVTKSPGLMNHCIWLDLEEFEARIEQFIAQLPKEVRRARRICREEQRIIQDAKDEARRLLEEARAESAQIGTDARSEADRVLAEANAEAERLVEASAIRQRALEQAEATIARAEESAEEIREQSYTYARQVMDNMVTSLKRLTTQIEQDRRQLEADQHGDET